MYPIGASLPFLAFGDGDVSITGEQRCRSNDKCVLQDLNITNHVYLLNIETLHNVITRGNIHIHMISMKHLMVVCSL